MRRAGRPGTHGLKTALRGLALLLALVAGAVGVQHLRNSGGPALSDPPPGALRVATFNVHYIWLNRAQGRWSVGDWQRRRGPLDATFKALDADVVAFQEMESFAGGDDDSVNLARAWLLENNPGYAAAAVGNWREFPSTQPIFYRTARLEALRQGWFFFSETPEVIYSRTFDGSYPAFASWADFRQRDTGETFRVINLHLDHSSAENRRKSIVLVADRVTGWIAAGRAVILAGDLNARLGSSLHDRLERTGLSFLPVQGASYHFDFGLNLYGAMDHLAHSAQFAPAGAPVVFRERAGAKWPADHYPVVADLVREDAGTADLR